MLKKQIILHSMLAILLFALAPMSLYAQDGGLSEDDLALVQVVMDAFENSLSQSSVKIDIATVSDQSTTMDAIGELLTLSESSQTTQITLDEAGNINGFYATLLQSTSNTVAGIAQPPAITSFELLIQDEEFYIRMIEPDATLAQVLPEGWFSADEGGLGGLMVAAFAVLASPEALGVYILDSESVSVIEELPSEELDGRSMRVFLLEIDFRTFVESGILGSLFDPSMFGGTDPLLNSEFENAGFSYQVWIGAEDNLVYQVHTVSTLADVELEVVGQVMTLSMVSETTLVYSDYNVPVEFPTVE